MNDTNDWPSLCELASKENDPQKLLDLIVKINRALKKCRQPRDRQDVSPRTDTELQMTGTITDRRDFDFYSFPAQVASTFQYDC
jgi:hypothetical protein